MRDTGRGGDNAAMPADRFRTVARQTAPAAVAEPFVPLAERLRPRMLDAVIGQSHLLAEGKPLRTAFASGRLHSMILWGPPGVGKTTLARLIADAFEAQFIAISAVLGGVKDIREAVERAQIARGQGRGTVVFVDEVHRFNKAVNFHKNQWVRDGFVQHPGLRLSLEGRNHG